MLHLELLYYDVSTYEQLLPLVSSTAIDSPGTLMMKTLIVQAVEVHWLFYLNQIQTGATCRPLIQRVFKDWSYRFN